MAAAEQKLTFAQHINELRSRLMWSLLFVAIGGGLGYALHGAILNVLQQPLNERLYYTAPTGAFSFIIKVCVAFGFTVALPVIVYQAFAFFGPLLPKKTKRSIVSYVAVSVALAAAGVAFAYFISLPAALHFLVNFGGSSGNIQAIITADEYFNFVLAYIAGFAALFQLPLIIAFINKMTPLKPSQLMGGTRYVILGSFVVAAIITPTPDPLNQALMAGPVILLYFLSVLIVAAVNKASRRHRGDKLPAPVAASQETVLADQRSLRPVSATVINSTNQRPAKLGGAHHPSARRMAGDVVIGPRHRRAFALEQRTVSYRPAPVRPMRSPQPPRETRIISDFLPAPE